MPIRYMRRVSLLPGLRVNVGKRGASFSVGRRGAWLTLGRGRLRETLSAPGTGIGWYEQQKVGAGRHAHLLPWVLILVVVLYLLAR
jgi:hypothetical protein